MKFISHFVLLAGLLGANVHASLLDEIQVYTDDINPPGEMGMELHINTTPKGITRPGYPGEVVNHGGLRITPEISYGLTPTIDVGLYIPMVRAGDGRWFAAGAKLRFKWLPVQPQTHNGWFSGLNFELSQIQTRFSESARALEVRSILGWKNSQWLLALNPILAWDLSPGFNQSVPELTLSTKVARQMTEHVAWGLEYYNGRGRLNNMLTNPLQEKAVYVVVDYEGQPFNFNVGIGKGLTSTTDTWTVKGIIDFPF